MSQKVEMTQDNRVQIIDTCRARTIYTPDFADLRRYNYIPVAIYQGMLLQTGKNNAILLPSESKYLGRGGSTHNRYILKRTVTGEYSVALNSPILNKQKPNDSHENSNLQKYNASHLQVELYALSPRALLNLDRVLCNGVMYKREKRSFQMKYQESPFRQGLKPMMQFWVYMGIESYWDHIHLIKSSIFPDNEDNKYYWIN